MNLKTNSIKQMLKEIKNITSNQVLILKKYTENRFLLVHASKQVDYANEIFSFHLQDAFFLQQVIENKRLVIDRYIKILGGIYEDRNTHNI
jgi:hypothetical protein